jgi:hypothetical protein
MRIRSIKPEFWSHRMHEVISETASLLALGLLNYADDAGRFLAIPRTIECTLFPVRAPKKAVGACLEELEAVGFIQRYSATMDGREVTLGVIASFRRHQVINRPFPSRLAPPPFTERSVNDTAPEPAPLTEDSPPDSLITPVMDRKGREGKGITPKAPRKRGAVDAVDPSAQPEPIRERMLAVNRLVRRLPSTRWSSKEFDAFTAQGLPDCPQADFDAMIEPLVAFYCYPFKPDSKDKNDLLNYRRSDLGTLLNHWAGEIDKANRWAATTAGGSTPRADVTGFDPTLPNAHTGGIPCAMPPEPTA